MRTPVSRGRRQPEDSGHELRLLNSLVPEFDYRAVHTTEIAAPPADTYRVARDLRLAEVPMFWALMRLRLFFERWLDGSREFPRSTSTIFEGFLDLGFVELGETPDREYLIGGIGKFWRMRSALPVTSLRGADDFVRFDKPGFAKVVLAIGVEPVGTGSRLRSEDRIAGTSRDARRLISLYWLLMRWPSWLLRRYQLRIVRCNAINRARVGPE